jgi:hypothetical protein
MKRLALVLSLPMFLTVCTAGDEEPASGSGSPPTEGPGSAETVAAQATSVAGETSLAVCPEGSNPDAPGPAQQARPHAGPMAFDRQSGLIVLKEFVADGTSSTWTFDVCTNTWQRMSPDPEPRDRRAWGPMAYDADSDLTITMLDDSSVWAYDVESDTWTEKGHAPLDNGGYAAARMVYDPGSGRVMVTAPRGMWTYDLDSDTWEPFGPFPRLGYPDHQLFAYDVSADRLLAIASGTRAMTFDPGSEAWTPTDATAPEFNTGWFASGGEAAYDEAAERTVVFSDRLVAAYDAKADVWTTLFEGAGCCLGGPFGRVGHWMVYDLVNERLVVYGGTSARYHDVWALDLETAEWIQLLR